MMLIRTLLISLLLFASSVFGQGVTSQEDFVVFVWNASEGGLIDGAGCTKAVWDASGDATDFMDVNGDGIVMATSVNVTDAGGLLVNINHAQNTTVITGTFAYIDFALDYDDDYYIITYVDDDNITVDVGGTGWINDTTCDISIGGTTGGLADLITNAPDLIDASSYNEDILVKGDETLSADQTIASGGGTASTLLRILGVDSNWARIVPTRTAIGGGTANGLLDTLIMPTITCGANTLFLNIDYIQIDGLYFTGTNTSFLVGSSVEDWQTYSNCVMDNDSTAAGARCMQTDNDGLAINCDFIMSGASGASRNVDMDLRARLIKCRFSHASSGPIGALTAQTLSTVIGCLFHDYAAGIAINIEGSTNTSTIAYNTFEAITGDCISLPNGAPAYLYLIFANIAKGGTQFVDNAYGGTAKVNCIAQYNHLNGNGTDYDTELAGDIGFQDLTSDPLFVNEGADDYNLQATSPAKNSGPMLGNRGTLSDKEAGGGTGGLQQASSLGGVLQE